MTVVSGRPDGQAAGERGLQGLPGGPELHGRGRPEVPAQGRGRRGLPLPLPLVRVRPGLGTPAS
ncbi:MAG: hypothetical protein MZV70_29555 [Desulfobacterales bacterium]|nr:hypothetical protein [Desulfobacterales bacterium]